MSASDRDPGEQPSEREEERIASLQRLAAHRVEQEKQDLLAAWLEAGGTEEEFEATWPAIRRELAMTRLHDLGDKARNRSLNRFRKQP